MNRNGTFVERKYVGGLEYIFYDFDLPFKIVIIRKALRERRRLNEECLYQKHENGNEENVKLHVY